MPTLHVAAPTSVAGSLDLEGVHVVAWDGEGPADGLDQVQVWVAPYAVGLGRDRLREALTLLPRLEMVQLLSAGVEPWPSILPDEVTLCGGRGIHGVSTAELAVALTLSLLRDLPTYAAQQRERSWQRHEPDTLEGRQVLVLGAGEIGQHVAAALGPLGADVRLVGRTAREGALGLDEAAACLPRTQVLVVALPLTDDTRGLVDATMLGALPDRAIVVNVARGPIVDQDALTAEVAAGRLRAGLDVTDPEPLPADHPLWGLDGVVLTPHAGGGATGWDRRAVRLVTDQLERRRDGRELRNVVSAGY
jgi:phosphoglycerate dehydrogenase-like enzyme